MEVSFKRVKKRPAGSKKRKVDNNGKSPQKRSSSDCTNTTETQALEVEDVCVKSEKKRKEKKADNDSEISSTSIPEPRSSVFLIKMDKNHLPGFQQQVA